ncbi:MAG TPA: 30S ribosomal protein S18 [Patescibacteria group bacterium]|nr:30S ribosomal protein S18 [Patescibacteria group bacterium]
MKRPILKRNRPKCFFCENHIEPDFIDFETLKKFLSDRGKIMSRERSGVCAKHQRHLSRAVKRARILALLPFVA